MVQNNDRTREQCERLALAADICAKASRLGKQAVERGEELDITLAFEKALAQTLEQASYNRDELTSVWAMFLLGAQVVKKLCRETDDYILGNHTSLQHGQPTYPQTPPGD